ncbi:MAG: MarR family transcriptional regulator [Roseovarius sp.]|nr:MarR family transcriptional regulator [Roseovarius sp.]
MLCREKGALVVATFKTTISHLVASLNRQLEKEVEEQLRHLRLPIEQVRVLEALCQISSPGGLTMSELAGYAVVDTSTFTKVVDRMVGENLVYRAPDPTDRRKVRVIATPDGEAVYAEMKPLLEAQEKKLQAAIADFSSEQVSAQVASVLHKLCNREGGQSSSSSEGSSLN